MSFSVNQRTQEFGIRMALGADAARIFRMVMQQGAWQLAIGLVLGAGGVGVAARSAGRGCVEKYFVQGQRARPNDLFRRRGTAHARGRGVLFRSRAPRHTRRSRGGASL